MKYLIGILSIFLFILVACHRDTKESGKEQLWKNPPQKLLTDEEIMVEYGEKVERINKFLSAEGLDGVLLGQVRNIYWVTAGTAKANAPLDKEFAPISLVIMKDGKHWLISHWSEAQRVMDESLNHLRFDQRQYAWYEANPLIDTRINTLKALVGEKKIGSDIQFPGTVLVAEKLKNLRYSLTSGELKRYRWVGKQTAEAVESVCRAVESGMDDFQIEAMTAAELRSRGIIPIVLLIGVDNRVGRYRNPLPVGMKLQSDAMISVVAQRWGMSVALTRAVHFGPMTKEYETRIEKGVEVNARFEAATVPGKSCAEIFEECKKWYADAGYPGEWNKHNQGGAIGYDYRDYVVYPGSPEVVQENQAFAWNPTITGVKFEDTFVTFKDHIEVVTSTSDWPTKSVTVNGRSYNQPMILIREAQ